MMLVNSYKNTATKDFDKAVQYMKSWKPSQELATEIHNANNKLGNVTIEDVFDRILTKRS